jgi:hypothetical protein
MDSNYSNYDMFDKLIANNRKAQSWTVFWVTALCLLAGVVLWMAWDIAQKKKIITEKDLVIQTQEEYLEAKNFLIDSLITNCNAGKKEIREKYDSVLTKTENVLKAIETAANDPAVSAKIPETQQVKLNEVKTNIERIKENMKNNTVKMKTRLFIQYNDKEKYRQVEEFSAALKNNDNYFIAPAEFIDNSFSTVIKFYNYQDDKAEKYLKEMVGKIFRINPADIAVSNETNPKVKQTVEVWIGTRSKSAKYQFYKKAN